MVRLTESLSAWGSPGFRGTLKRELEALGAQHLPLQQGLSRGSYALDEGLEAMILSVTDAAASIHVHAGIFYCGIIAGCSCADDPTPVDQLREYCEVTLDIDKETGEAKVTLLAQGAGPSL